MSPTLEDLPRPALLANPTSPMTDDRSPRIHLFLTIWTLLLIGLVLVEIRRLPPGLTVLLVPYLALMARHGIGRLRHQDRFEPAMPSDDAVESAFDDDPDECAERPGFGDRSGGDDSPMPAPVRMQEEPVTPPRRSRARRRPRAPETEPSAASWVQVRPGRFVRVEEMSQDLVADASGGDGRADEPHGDTPPDEVETASISTDTGTVIPALEVGDADRDVPDAIIPEQPGEGSAEPASPPGGRTEDARGDHAWNGSWIVQVPQGDLDS